MTVKQCSLCLYDESHPFGLFIDDDGVCSGCRVHQEKYQIDWGARKAELVGLLEESRGKANGKHDCVIYVDSDAESFYLVYLIKKVLGFEPLLVNFNDYFRTDIGHKNLNTLRTTFDCDLLNFTPKLSQYKKIIKESYLKTGNFFWPIQAAKTALPFNLAINKAIPLVIWGGHQGMEQTGMFSHHDYVNMSQWYRSEHDLFGFTMDEIVSGSSLLRKEQMSHYTYPDNKKIIQSQVKGLYLNNYFLWDPLKQNNQMLEYGYTPEYNASTFDYFDRSGSSVYFNVHDISRMKRTGYHKVRDHLCREIRHSRISKTEAIELESFYNSAERDPKPFLKWLGFDEDGIKWFELHYFKGVDSPSVSRELTLSDKLKALCPTPQQPQKTFLLFDKSLYLKSQR